MPLIENLVTVLGLVTVMAWCAGCMAAFLHMAQMLGVERGTPWDRALALLTAFAGLAFALWTLKRAHDLWRKRCARINLNG